MGRQAGLCATVVVVASNLLWLLLLVGIVTGSAQAQHGSATSVQVVATVSPQATPTKGQPAQQGKTVQNEPVPSWVILSLLLLGCAVLLAVLGFMLWIGGLLPWHRRGRPAGWGYEVVLALLAALGVVVASQVFNVFSLPIWVRIVLPVLAVVLALTGAVVKLRSTQLERERSWTRQVRGLLQVPLGTDGQLPRLSALSPYRLGVSPSRYGSEEQRGDDPYVQRVIDDSLDQALHSKRFVLVVGDSKAGKSRTAYEAATRLQYAGRSHDPRVLVPKSTGLLGQLLDLDPPLDLHPEPALLWLDNLTESELEALTLALLDRLTAQMIVLGTMTAQRYDLVVRKDSDIGRTARLALQHRATKVIPLEADLIAQERAEAEQKYPQERFEAGIGEQLVAVDKLTERYDNARQGANYHGWAVVQAAIDWTRMNVGRPISQRELVALCPLYLQTHARHDDEGHKKALTWACEPVGSHIPLVEELPSDRDEPSYVPFDYLVAAADGQGGRPLQPILDPAWDEVLALVSPSEAVRTGVSAYLRQLLPRAQKIFTAVAAGNAEAASEAAYNLGVLLEKQGDVEGAKAAYQQAIASGHADQAPEAAYNLGVLLEKQGDVEGALAAYQRAIDSGVTKAAPSAALILGVLLEKQGDVEGAKAAYQQVIASGHAEAAPKAALSLGVLLGKQGDVEGARGAKAAYQQAIASRHAEVAPQAMVHLGLLLEKWYDAEGAKAAYQQAIESRHAEAAPKAMVHLGVLLEKWRDVEGAKAAYQQAIESGHADEAPKTMVHLGVLLEKQGDVEGAKAAYQQAIESGHADWSPWAAYNLGLLLAEQGDVEGAKAAYQQAIESRHAEAAPKAALGLGLLLEKQGDVAGLPPAMPHAFLTGRRYSPFTDLFDLLHLNKTGASARTKVLETPRGQVLLRDFCPPSLVERLRPDSGLHVFARTPEREHTLLLNIAKSPDSALALAYTPAGEIVGEVTIAPADEWWQGIENVYEVAVEVSSGWRRLHIAQELLAFAFELDALEDMIFLKLGLSWYWDMEGLRIPPRLYRQMVAHLFESHGFKEYDTTEPNVSSEPTNILMARIGKNVDRHVATQFLTRLRSSPRLVRR